MLVEEKAPSGSSRYCCFAKIHPKWPLVVQVTVLSWLILAQGGVSEDNLATRDKTQSLELRKQINNKVLYTITWLEDKDKRFRLW